MFYLFTKSNKTWKQIIVKTIYYAKLMKDTSKRAFCRNGSLEGKFFITLSISFHTKHLSSFYTKASSSYSTSQSWIKIVHDILRIPCQPWVFWSHQPVPNNVLYYLQKKATTYSAYTHTQSQPVLFSDKHFLDDIVAPVTAHLMLTMLYDISFPRITSLQTKEGRWWKLLAHRFLHARIQLVWNEEVCIPIHFLASLV